MHCAVSFWCPGACNGGMAIVSGKWETKCDDARIRVNVRQAVLAGLYNSSEVLASKCWLKISAFFIYSPSLHFPFLHNGGCRFELCPVLEAPFDCCRR